MRASLTIIFVATLIASCYCGVVSKNNLITLQPRMFEKEINESIECIKDLLNDGVPSAGIPSFNPLIIENLAFDMDSELLKGSIDVDDFELAGATGFIATDLKASLGGAPGGGIGLKLSFTFDVKKVKLNTYYDADITLLDLLPVYGKGLLRADLKGLKITGGVLITIGDEIGIQDLDIKLSMDDSKVTLTGMLDNEPASAIISEAINDLIPTLLNEHSQKVSEVIAKVFESVMEEGSDLNELLEVFGPCLESILG